MILKTGDPRKHVSRDTGKLVTFALPWEPADSGPPPILPADPAGGSGRGWGNGSNSWVVLAGAVGFILGLGIGQWFSG